eukprot:gene4089-8460_t
MRQFEPRKPLYLRRGETYEFHLLRVPRAFPFRVFMHHSNAPNCNTDLNSALCLPPAAVGNTVVTFSVPQNAPQTLSYGCLHFRNMGNTIYILPDHNENTGALFPISGNQSSSGRSDLASKQDINDNEQGYAAVGMKNDKKDTVTNQSTAIGRRTQRIINKAFSKAQKMNCHPERLQWDPHVELTAAPICTERKDTIILTSCNPTTSKLKESIDSCNNLTRLQNQQEQTETKQICLHKTKTHQSDTLDVGKKGQCTEQYQDQEQSKDEEQVSISLDDAEFEVRLRPRRHSSTTRLVLSQVYPDAVYPSGRDLVNRHDVKRGSRLSVIGDSGTRDPLLQHAYDFDQEAMQRDLTALLELQSAIDTEQRFNEWPVNKEEDSIPARKNVFFVEKGGSQQSTDLLYGFSQGLDEQKLSSISGSPQNQNFANSTYSAEIKSSVSQKADITMQNVKTRYQTTQNQGDIFKLQNTNYTYRCRSTSETSQTPLSNDELDETYETDDDLETLYSPSIQDRNGETHKKYVLSTSIKDLRRETPKQENDGIGGRASSTILSEKGEMQKSPSISSPISLDQSGNSLDPPLYPDTRAWTSVLSARFHEADDERNLLESLMTEAHAVWGAQVMSKDVLAFHRSSVWNARPLNQPPLYNQQELGDMYFLPRMRRSSYL